jgi:hypothetical protein
VALAVSASEAEAVAAAMDEPISLDDARAIAEAQVGIVASQGHVGCSVYVVKGAQLRHVAASEARRATRPNWIAPRLPRQRGQGCSWTRSS